MPKTASPNGTIDYASLRQAQRRYEWFEMDRDDDNPDSAPLRVRVQRMTATELEAIPVDKTPIKDVIQQLRDYIVAWNLTAQTDAGDVVPVPPPAELENAGDVAANLLTLDQLHWLFGVLRAGHLIKLAAQKKALTRSDTSPASSPEADSAGSP